MRFYMLLSPLLAVWQNSARSSFGPERVEWVILYLDALPPNLIRQCKNFLRESEFMDS
jgi:hypothetical protein